MKSLMMGAVAALCWAGVAQAAPPPASAFGRIPVVLDAAISPGGQRIAILGGTSDQRVVSIATIDQQGLPVLQLGEVEGIGLRWVGDDYVVATVAYWEALGDMQRTARFERQISITTEGKAAARMLPTGGLAGRMVMLELPVVGVTADGDPRLMMVGLVDNGGASATQDTRIKRKGVSGAARALWKVNPANGQGALIERGGFDTSHWGVDSSGDARVRIDVDEVTREVSLYGRAKGARQWTPIFTDAPQDGAKAYLGYIEADDAALLRDGDKVIEYRLADGSSAPYPDVEVGDGLLWDLERHAVLAAFRGGEAKWFDAELGAAHGVLSRAFKGRDVIIEGWSRDRSRVIARVDGPTSPPTWYLYDRPRKEVSLLGEEYPELKGAALGQMQRLTYKARDGLDIPAFLTLPPDAPEGTKLPLIVLPHGGPAAHDDYAFDWMVQFLATRGYAVLQPQFRGSTGYGEALEAAGEGEWGGKIQTDLLDGIASLAAQGRIDPTRVCIVGMSFGGYSALAGAALHPDAYRCAASIAGMADLGQMLRDDARTYGTDSDGVQILRANVGVAKPGVLAETSPASHAADVKAPILLIHGDKDTVVLFSQSQLMAQRLKEAGKPYEFVTLEDENHYLTKAANRTKALEALGAFLAKNLPLN